MDDGASPPWPTALVVPTLIVVSFAALVGLANVAFTDDGNFGGFSVFLSSLVGLAARQRASGVGRPALAAVLAACGVAGALLLSFDAATPMAARSLPSYLAAYAVVAWAGCATYAIIKHRSHRRT